MGIDREGTEFLLFAKAAGVEFDATVTIGRQQWSIDEPAARAAGATFPEPGADRVVRGLRASADGYAEELFALLGARRTEALDVADFEGAEIIHDMNEPIGEDLHARASCVLDGGALEHVFDVPQAIENCMRMVRPGGHLLAITPANNQVGHGFYQFSPELYFRVLCPANGFTVRHVLLNEVGLRRRWLRVTDPALVGRRVTVSTLGEATLYVVAQRTGEARLVETPQQSDYRLMWDEGRSGATGGGPTRAQQRRKRLRRLVGPRLGTVLREMRVAVGNAGAASGVERVDLAKLARRSPEESTAGPSPTRRRFGTVS